MAICIQLLCPSLVYRRRAEGVRICGVYWTPIVLRTQYTIELMLVVLVCRHMMGGAGGGPGAGGSEDDNWGHQEFAVLPPTLLIVSTGFCHLSSLKLKEVK